MNQETWDRLVAIIERVRRLPLEQQTAAVDAECGGDLQLRSDVLALLAADATRDPGFLTSPLAQTASFDVFAGRKLGDFELHARIGSGASGVVYRARQISLDRPVAVKVFSTPEGLDPRREERFRREAQTAARLRHPHLVPVFAHGVERGVLYYAMELVDGHSLAEIAGGQVAHPRIDVRSPQVCAALVAQIAEALHHCHCAGVVHRDVKPSNVLIDRDGNARLVDFGIAAVATSTALTQTGAIQGTPHYMSPEQVLAARVGIDHRTDIYSAGAVLYELLTRRRPFEGDTLAEVFRRILHTRPRPVRQVNPQCPRPFADICERAMSLRPRDRYARASELAEDLRDALRGAPVRAHGTSLRQRAADFTRRHPSVLRLAGAVAVLAMVATVASQWQRRAEGAERQASLVVDLPAGVTADLYVGRLWPTTLGATWTQIASAASDRFTGALAPGRYLLQARADGGALAEVERDLLAGETTEVRLRPSQLEATRDMVLLAPGSVDVPYRVLQERGPGLERPVRVEYGAVWIDRAPVTNGEFLAFLESRGDNASRGDDETRARLQPWGPDAEAPRKDWKDLPVTSITWYQARDYAEAHGLRLPTAAEALAARLADGDGGWLDDLLTAEGPSVFVVGRKPDVPVPVITGKLTSDQYLAHAAPARGLGFGPLKLCHPVGNVLEWTSDAALCGPADAPRADLSTRFLCGTMWFRPPDKVGHEALRNLGLSPAILYSPEIGFRCVRTALDRQ